MSADRPDNEERRDDSVPAITGRMGPFLRRMGATYDDLVERGYSVTRFFGSKS